MSFLDKVFSRKPPTQNEFAQIVVRAFEQAGISGLEYREEDFALKIPGREATIFLHNTFSNYCLVQAAERKEIVDRLVAGIANAPEIASDFATARTRLMPVVRDAAYYSLNELLTQKDGSRDPGLMWQARPLADGLIAGVAYDTEHSIATLNRQTLSGWGIGFHQAFSLAKDNLWERTDPNRLVGQNGLYWGEWGDSYDSSRMLLPELIYRLAVDGEPVAFVPNRDALLVTGKNNIAGLRLILKNGGESHFKQGHPVSPNLYWLDEGVWKLYVPEDLELQTLWMTTKRQRDALDYARQKELLEKTPGYEGILIARFTVFSRPDGSMFSVGAWPRNVQTSLPRAEMIGFVLDPESKDSFMVLWDAAIPIVGHLLDEEPGLTPARYRARRYPSEEQIARLRSVARNPK